MHYLCWYWLFDFKNRSEKSSTMKICKHIPCRYPMPTILGFDHIENKHTLYHGKEWWKSSVIF